MKEMGFVGWIRGGVSLSASGLFVVTVAVVTVAVAVVISICVGGTSNLFALISR